MRLFALENFSNYQNKTERYFAELDDYLTHSSRNYGFTNINFRPLDGVDTEQVVNLPPYTTGFAPDYLVVVEEDADVIVSRWFIMESKMERGLQYRLTLHRDLIADNWKMVLNGTSIISRGWSDIGNITQSAICNAEGFQVSEIKQKEELLKDKTDSAWIVGYIKDKNVTPPQNITWQRNINALNETSVMREILDTDHGITVSRSIFDAVFETHFQTTNDNHKAIFNKTECTFADDTAHTNTWRIQGQSIPSYLGDMMVDTLSVDYYYNAQESFATNPGYHYGDELDDIVGLYFYGPDSRVYQLKKKLTGKVRYAISMTDELADNLRDMVREIANRVPSVVYGDYNPLQNDKVSVDVEAYQYVRDYVSTVQYTVPISSNHAKLNDRPWSMFAMPLNSIKVIDNAGTWTTDDNLGINFAKAASQDFGDIALDIQLLPYCPIPEIVTDTGLNLRLLNENEGFDYVKTNNTKKSVLIWARESSGEIVIPYTYNLPNDPLTFKVEMAAKKFRLTAPNFSSGFEFTPALNGGIKGFNVNFTYEPNQSYMRVAPIFNKFYGGDFKDGRGLIVSTDLSLPKITDNWVNYQLQNKNYQKIFDRKIESMEFARNVGIGQTAALTATALFGDSAFNAIGTGVETLVHKLSGTTVLNDMELGYGQLGQIAATSAINTAFDVARQNDAIEDAKFNQQMQIANIKAQPQAITQIGAFNINSKLFPILEIYDAAGGEKRNIMKYIEYRSMNISRTATIAEYLKPEGRTWIEATLIDTFDFKGDAHELATLKETVSSGIYFVKE